MSGPQMSRRPVSRRPPLSSPPELRRPGAAGTPPSPPPGRPALIGWNNLAGRQAWHQRWYPLANLGATGDRRWPRPRPAA